MRNLFKWASWTILFLLFSCAKETESLESYTASMPGVYGEFDSIEIVNEPATRATVDPRTLKYKFEVGDRINIWSEVGTTLLYDVESVTDDGRATFAGGGYTLTNGETYYSSHPLIRSTADKYKSLFTTYDGQRQTANDNANHIADYTYTYASAPCENGNTSFQYHHLCSFFLFSITLPDALTLTELTITAATDEFFAIEGTSDVTTGGFTPKKMSNSMTLKLGEDNTGIEVSDKHLIAYLSVAPCPAGDYIIRVKDTDNKVYTSTVISQNALAAGKGVWFATSVFEGEEAVVARIGANGYKTLEAAFAAAQDGDTITLLADCSGNGIKALEGKFNETGLTVDFKGHTYTVDGTLVGSSGTETQAFQLLKDNKITFTNGTVYSEKALFLVQNYSNLTLDGMTLTLNNANYAYGYTLSNNNGTIVINNSTINANPAGLFAFDVCRNASYPSVGVTVTGESEISGDVEISASGNDAKDGFSLMLETPITGSLVIDPSAAAAMKATPEKALVCKKKDVNQAAPAGFKWVEKDEDTDILVVCEYVAQIGEAKYETLEEAFAAAEDGDEIKLLEDCSGNGIKAEEGKFTSKGLTIDFNGHTYTMDGTMVGSTGTQTQAFQLLKNNKITFKNGSIESSKAKMLIQNYSDLTLEGMTLTLDNPNYASAYTLSNNNGNVVIDGTTINANPAGGFAFDVCRYSSYPSVNVTVKGESEINGNVEVSASGSDAKDGFKLTVENGTFNGNLVIDPTAKAAMASAPEKTVISKDNDVTLEAPEEFKWQDNGDGTSMLVACKYVAQVGDKQYETLVEAVAKTSVGTITLLADTEGDGLFVKDGDNKNITIDFAGHSYTVTGKAVGSAGTATQALHLEKNNTIVLKNGTITCTADAGVYMLVQNYSNLTLEDMILDGTNLPGNTPYTLSNNNGTVTIKDTQIDAKSGGFAFDVCRYGSYPSVNVTVTGDSEINGNVEVSASGSDAKDGFSLTVENGTFNGNLVIDPTAKTAMASAPEKTVISKDNDVTLEAPEGFKWQDNGDGTSTLVARNYVAQVGDKQYETLVEAVAETSVGTITLLADTDGDGLFVKDGDNKNITIDFAGHSYTVTGKAVGSSGTATQALHLEKNNTIVLKNGTVTSTADSGVKMLVQNYSNLTLDNMVLDGTNLPGAKPYTLSNNNGNVVIKDTQIDAKSGGFAFDVCRYSIYPSVDVTVTGASIINGDVEVYASNNIAMDGFSLMLENTINGNIIIDASAASAMASDPNKAKVSKKDGVSQEAPNGYMWVDNGNGTSSLAFQSLSATLAAVNDGATIKLSDDYDATNDAMDGGSRQFKISKSVTIDGQGHTITTKNRGFGVGMDATKPIDVTFKDVTINNTSSDARCIDTRGNIRTLTLDGVTLSTDGAPSGYTQPLTIGGDQASTATVNITNSTIQTNTEGTQYYAIITFNPVNMTISGSTLKGWACIYAKEASSSAGSAGSIFNIDGCDIISKNIYSGSSNAFAAFVLNDNNVTVNVTNSEMQITGEGDQKQFIVHSSKQSSVNLGIGNTVTFTGTTGYFNGSSSILNISGGTFNENPPSNCIAPGHTVAEGTGTWTVE